MSYTSPALDIFTTEDLDVNFEQAAEAADAACGMNPDDETCMFSGVELEQEMGVVPRTEWPSRIQQIDAGGGWLETMICKVKSQGREGSCVYNAAAQAHEITLNWTYGVDKWTELSAISGYRNNARGPSSGSSVPGALAWMTDHGLIPADSERNKQFVKEGLFAHVHPPTGYYVEPQKGWPATAKYFRVQEFLKLTTVEEWVTAQCAGFVCIGGRDMHCICHVRPLMDGDRLYSLYVNSWGPWGKTFKTAVGDQMGFGIDSEAKIRTMVARGAWAVRTVYVPPWLEG